MDITTLRARDIVTTGHRTFVVIGVGPGRAAVVPVIQAAPGTRLRGNVPLMAMTGLTWPVARCSSVRLLAEAAIGG